MFVLKLIGYLIITAIIIFAVILVNNINKLHQSIETEVNNQPENNINPKPGDGEL